MGSEIAFEKTEQIDYNADWYKGLTDERKRAILKEAILKFPYLKNHMEKDNVRARDKDFVNHYSFRLMLDVLRGN